MSKIIKQGYTFDDVLVIPQFSDIETRASIDLSQEFLGLGLEIPIISANMDYVTGYRMAEAMAISGGLGILHRFGRWEDTVQDINSLALRNHPIAFSVGIKSINDSLIKISSIAYLLGTESFIVCIDVAHGHHQLVYNLIASIKNQFPAIKIIAGNIATREGAIALAQLGVDAVKVGIGPGSVCTTRSVAGAGIPQLTAIMDVAEALEKYPPTKIIADGGIRTSGDIVKALVAGADVVMLGHLLAGHVECPGEAIQAPDGRRYKPYRGQSIFGSNNLHYTPEGISGYVEERGTVSTTLNHLTAGIRSGFSYVGAKNISELRENAYFIQVSAGTLVESNTRVPTFI